MTDFEAPVHDDQQDENEDIPQQFVKKGRVHDLGDLAGRHSVEIEDINRTVGRTTIEQFQPPWQRGGSTGEFLIEVVAQPADGLGQHDARRDRIGEGREWNSPAAAGNPGANSTQCHGAPDTKATLPDRDRLADPLAVRAEIRLPVGHHVIEPTADQSKGHGPQRDVIDDAAFTTALLPPTITDDQRGNNARNDAQCVGADRDRPKMPNPLGRTGDVCQIHDSHSALPVFPELMPFGLRWPVPRPGCARRRDPAGPPPPAPTRR